MTYTEQTMRGLLLAWGMFEKRLDKAPIIQKLNRGTLTIEDYQNLLKNLRQQVIDGGAWIARAASSIDPREHSELRSHFMRHAVTEHRDFKMLEANYVASGGKLEDIQQAEKNLGSEAFSAYMFHRASQPNPFDLLGAMFIIEGLGQRKAREWGEAIQQQLNIGEDAVSFLLYHADHDDDHLDDFEDWVAQTATSEAASNAICRTARMVGRLYALQLEEIDNV